MCRYVTVLVSIFIFISPLCSQTPSSAITFDERIHSFGNILEEKGKVSHTFVFHNNGKTDVTIDEIYSGCGCIGKVLSKDPVKPGGKGKVTIIFNPEYKSGFFTKEIVVYSNNKQNYNRIWVEGTITPAEHPIEDDYPYNFGQGLFLRLKVMAFGYVKPGETKQMVLDYANSDNKEMTLNFVVDGNEAGLKFTSPGKIKAKARGEIGFSYTMPSIRKNDVSIRVFVYVNGKKLSETLELKILNQENLKEKKSPVKGTT